MVKHDKASLWQVGICNKLGSLSQECKEHKGTKNTFFIHKKKPVGRKETYLQAVYVLRPQKYETHRVRLIERVNLVGGERDARTTTEGAVKIKTQRNRAIYDNMGSTPTLVIWPHYMVCTKMCTIIIHSKIRISQYIFLTYLVHTQLYTYIFLVLDNNLQKICTYTVTLSTYFTELLQTAKTFHYKY